MAEPFLVDVLGRKQKWRLRLLAISYLVGFIAFFAWWLRLEHVAGVLQFGVNTLLVIWTFFLPVYFLFFVERMKRVNPRIEIPGNWRVAMITTRAPSEPFEIVKETLRSMLAQSYPHDTWLADEDPSDEILAWCKSHGVKVSSRRGVEAYHRAQWPRRTRCKEGNLAYFYDHFGYEKYDFVAQLDADHVPEPGYLEAVLRPFVDLSIGYVSAPSICDKNAHKSWSARGRLFAESLMHGPLQAGYTNGFAPLCIGSHYAVRTRALCEIGGLGPELAEDHSTTLTMNAYGWRGAHAIDAIAHGEGPPTFADCVVQEFQWSRSLMVVLLTLLPKFWRRLPWKLRVQFLFSELWYPLFGGTMLVGLSLPPIAIFLRQPWVQVSYVDFVLHSLPLVLLAQAVLAFLSREQLLRPVAAPVFSWEALLFQLVRWPWAALGSLMGIVMIVRQHQVGFRVTPKGDQAPTSLSWKILLPYAAVVVLSHLPTFFVGDAGRASGYYFFLILAQIGNMVALFSIVLIHRYETRRLATT